jgi:KipI family sensor histidine kinase inhibitor
MTPDRYLAGHGGTARQILSYGPEALLVDGVDDPVGLAAALRRRRIDGVGEIVPGERTLLVTCTTDLLQDLRRLISELAPDDTDHPADPVTIAVRYDGEDLEEVAAVKGLTTEEVVGRHSSGQYRVGFCGFSPGFAYLTGLDATLHLPRRDTPRVRVPAGAVAIAATYCAVYPSASPGGWHVIGSTDTNVWDPGRDEPALLLPGTEVRFERLGGGRR